MSFPKIVTAYDASILFQLSICHFCYYSSTHWMSSLIEFLFWDCHFYWLWCLYFVAIEHMWFSEHMSFSLILTAYDASILLQLSICDFQCLYTSEIEHMQWWIFWTELTSQLSSLSYTTLYYYYCPTTNGVGWLLLSTIACSLLIYYSILLLLLTTLLYSMLLLLALYYSTTLYSILLTTYYSLLLLLLTTLYNLLLLLTLLQLAAGPILLLLTTLCSYTPILLCTTTCWSSLWHMQWWNV